MCTYPLDSGGPLTRLALGFEWGSGILDVVLHTIYGPKGYERYESFEGNRDSSVEYSYLLVTGINGSVLGLLRRAVDSLAF